MSEGLITLENLSSRSSTISKSSELYPNRLLKMPPISIDRYNYQGSPDQLYVVGSMKILENINNNHPVYSLSGPRKDSPQGRFITGVLGNNMARDEFGITVGGADGTDSTFINSYMDIGGKNVIVVVPQIGKKTGANNETVLRVANNGGLLISDKRGDASIDNGDFVKRNRYLPFIANNGMIIVEGLLDSGTNRAAEFTEEYFENRNEQSILLIYWPTELGNASKISKFEEKFSIFYNNYNKLIKSHLNRSNNESTVQYSDRMNFGTDKYNTDRIDLLKKIVSDYKKNNNNQVDEASISEFNGYIKYYEFILNSTLNRQLIKKMNNGQQGIRVFQTYSELVNR